MENLRLSFSQVEEYRAHLIREEHSPQTVQKYLRVIMAFFRCLPPGNSLTKEAVLDFKEMLARRYKTATGNSMLVAVNGFLTFLGAPQYRVRLFKVQRQTFRSRDRELTREEYIRLVQAARRDGNERLALLLQAICSTGIRVSEHRFITAESLGAGSVFITNKGRSRMVLLPEELRRLLRAYCARRGIRSGPVFVSRTGRPLDRSNIWAQMKGLCARAGVDPAKVFPHNLRHLFAVTFYRLERDIVRLADILGHASIDTTRIYTFISPEEQSRALSRLRLLI